MEKSKKQKKVSKIRNLPRFCIGLVNILDLEENYTTSDVENLVEKCGLNEEPIRASLKN